MIRVFYDSQIFLAQRRGGISRYFVELICQFHENPDLGITPVLNFESTPNLHLASALQMPLQGDSSNRYIRALKFYDQAKGDLRFQNYDIRHFTFYSGAYANFQGSTVSTLYDMIPETIEKNGRNPHLKKKKYMERSTGVLSISHTSLEEMAEIYGFKPKLWEVSHLGVSESFNPTAKRLKSLPERYFLFVGQRGGYKRAELAMRAFASLNADDVKLLFVGGELPSRAEIRLAKWLGIDQRVSYIHVTDDELPSYYVHAIALIYPNLHEGFGFPSVEAQKCGTPVVATDNKINREISGDAIVYFEADNSSDLGKRLSKLLENGRSRKSEPMIYGDYSWLTCAKVTADFYKTVLGNPS